MKMRSLVLCLMCLLIRSDQLVLSKTPAAKSSSRHSKPAVISQKALIEKGKAIFQANQCLDCHSVAGKGNIDDGLTLDGIAQRRTALFMQKQLKDPEEHVSHAPKEFGGDPNMMTAPNLSSSEINAVIAYLRSLPALKSKSP